MSRRRYSVPDETAARQARASDPGNSAWVSANAGSGKTHVLSQRVVRLLLDGTEPARILCLTYTRAAAANMSNRVFSTLADWALLDDGRLAEAIAAVDGRAPSAARLGRARRLFAQALETPGGLKIQTIHAFCEAVLQQFPIEANVPAHFRLLDARMEQALLAEARREMLTGAVAGDPRLAEAFATVLERGGEHGLDQLLAEIMGKRDALAAFIAGMARDARPYGSLYGAFGFAEDETADSIAGDAWPVPGFPPAYFEAFRRAAEETDARRALDDVALPAAGAFAETDPVRRLDLLAKAFLKAGGEPYGPATFKKALLARLPDLPERYEAAAAALSQAADRLALMRMLEGTAAALDLAGWMIGRYEQLKAGRGFLDFNDLIVRTLRLLSRPEAGAWVQYKLDRGIDHVLLDEAQDTSPDQWAVVRRLADEFFAGLGARDGATRTVFAVGDEKQSIYSFQGAVPEAFDRTGREFQRRVNDAEARFERIRLTLSFRSTNDVLHAVDRVFADERARRGLSQDADPIRHDAIRHDAPGYVELWPSQGAAAAEEPDDWAEPVDHASAPAVAVAGQVAGTIRRWLDRGETIEGSGRRLRPGDVMVLVRKRDRFVHALARGLKERGVPVAGADRLSLPAHIAVKDMIALGRHLLQPEDDLSLAAVLRSPVFGLSDDALYALAACRPEGRSLARALREKAGSDAALAGIVETLDRWAGEAAFKPPFEFYAGLLGRDGVRRRMAARLGQEAGDILDEFLSFCLAEERAGQPGLEAFLATLETAGPEIRREMDQGRDEVRILTVHAAKGLEAPVVFLVDGGAASFSIQHLPRLIPLEDAGIGWQGPGFLWRAAAAVKNEASRAVEARLAERADDEYRRLLYVGMTRAEDRLVVCGYHGRRPRGADTWHAIVERALAAAPETVDVPHPVTGEPVLRFRVTQGPPLAAEPEDAAETVVHAALPADLSEDLPQEDGLPRPLSPSGASLLIDDDGPEPVVSTRSPVLDGEEEQGAAVLRGLAVHKLMQMLPMLSGNEREAAALRYLQRAAPGWGDGDRLAVWREVAAVLDAPGFAAAFSAGSRAEVAIMGEVTVRGRQRAVSGKIDRLAVAADRVLIVDYKTNRPPPATLAEVPTAYVMQLALYRALLEPLYPGRRVEAALLFTAAPRLIPVPQSAMADALARLAAA